MSEEAAEPINGTALEPLDSPTPVIPLLSREAALSPSLRPVAAAFEIKFLVPEAQAREIELRARQVLQPDPHANPALGGAYETSTVYCDTADFAVYRQVAPCRRSKHRIRRYGQEPVLFLERKWKRGDRVRKRRSLIDETLLARLSREFAPEDWAGGWFHERAARLGLRPVCRITYERLAFVGEGSEGPLRLTFDRNIRGLPARDWAPRRIEEGIPVFTGLVVCELKFQAALPGFFKGLIADLGLLPTPASKYRAFVTVSGLAGGLSNA